MSTFTPAETLRQHRPLLLAMEAIGWFHMAGKAKADFLRQHGGDEVQYDEHTWHNYETPPFPWDDLLGWTKQHYGSNSSSQSYKAWPGSFAEFTEKHAGRKPAPGLLGLLQAAHGIVSGVEKNLPKRTSEYLNQTVLHMWLSSPWGHPKRNLLADPPEILTPQGWRQLVSEIQRVLEDLRDLGTKQVEDVDAWRRWREQAIGADSFIRRAFLSTLAETRLPNNDVTLWDQSYVAAALFKSAVAGALLNSQHPWRDKGIKQKTRWRLLTVAIGTEHYEARSVKIGDWTGAQAAIDAFFRRVSELVEVVLAVGSLLYRDSSVAVFSFPGERFDESVPAGWLHQWEDWLQGEVETMAQDLDLETPPYVRLSEPTRSLVPMVKERREARKVIAVPVHKPWDVVPAEDKGHVCPVCGVRLNGDPASKTRPCQVCRERRHHRRDDWLKGQLSYDTIWFEEVADRNDRLALLTFSLDLEPWLNGRQVDSLRAQAIPEWARFNPVLSSQQNPIAPENPFESLFLYIKNAVGKALDRDDPVLTNLQDGYRHEKDWQSFFQKIVEDRADAPDWDNLNDDERAAWLTHQLFVKLPSPGRVYRFWREAEDFFQDLLREFRQIASRSESPWRVRRLVLIPKDKSGWRDLTLYDGRWREAPISLLYVQRLGGFITASNLARLLEPEVTGGVLQGKTLILEEEDQFGRSREMEIERVKDEFSGTLHHLGVYAPVIPLEISPLRFRVLVPLEAASACVDLASQWWKERFARVWDRLPLRVGVVAFPRTLPYQAVAEAARNVEEALQGQERGFFSVEQVEKRASMVALYLRSGHQSFLRMVPITMPDGREDVFYPYVEVEDRQLRFPKDFRHPDGRIFRHVADLQPGDGVKVTPAGVLTLFMESTAARFRVGEPRPLDDWQRMRDIWQILLRVAPSKTALQRLRSELAQLDQSWRDPEGNWEASENLRQDMYRALLVHHLDSPPAGALARLTQAAMEGLLTWALNWHLSVLKEDKED